MAQAVSPQDFFGAGAQPASSGVVAPEDFFGAQTAQPPAPTVDAQVIGSSDGVPIFADPKQNADLAQSMGDLNGRIIEKGAEGASFGLAPYAEAPVVSAVKGVPLSEGLKTARDYTAETSKRYPVASALAEGAGMASPTLVTGGLLNPAESIGGRALQAGVVGGGVGAASAGGHDLGSGETDNIVRDTGVGAGVGAGAGAAGSLAGDFVVKPIIDWVARKFSPEAVNNQAVQRIVQRISQDTKGGGPSAQDMLDALHAAGSEPHAIADVGGNNILGEAGRVARAPGEGKQIAVNALNSRDAAEGTNLAGVVGSDISGGGSAYSAVKALQGARSNAAAPLYEKAFQGGSTAPLQSQFENAFSDITAQQSEAVKAVRDANNAMTQAQAQASRAGNNVYGASSANDAAADATKKMAAAQQSLDAIQQQKESVLSRLRQAQADGSANAPGAVWTPRIQQFLDDPILKGGINKGLQIQRLESLAEGKTFNPSEYAITGTDAEGNPIVGSVPNMRLLDAGKKGLDAIIQENRNDFGKLNEYGRAVDMVRRSYLKELDGVNPDYAAARASYAGPSQSLGAVNEGAKILTKRPEEIADDIAGLSPGDKEFYKLGAADTLIKNIASAGRSANEANKIAQSTYAKSQLRPLFDSEDDYNGFIGAIDRANRRFETKTQTIGNSATAGRIAEDDSGGHGNPMLTGIAEAAAGMHTGQSIPVFEGAMNLVKGLSGNRPPSDPAVNAAISRMLFETNPANRAQIMGRLLQQMQAGQPAARITRPALPGALIGSGYPSLMSPNSAAIANQLMQPNQ